VVECTALEMRHRCKPIGGSNPPLSAICRRFYDSVRYRRRSFALTLRSEIQSIAGFGRSAAPNRAAPSMRAGWSGRFRAIMSFLERAGAEEPISTRWFYSRTPCTAEFYARISRVELLLSSIPPVSPTSTVPPRLTIRLPMPQLGSSANTMPASSTRSTPMVGSGSTLP
jgi:hypothetical protein